MRRGLLLSGVVAALVGFGTMPSGATANTVKYQFTTTGLIDIAHTDTGVEGNGNDCQLSRDAKHSPFDDHYKLALSWDTVYNVTFNSSGSADAAVKSRSVKVDGTHFSYGGYHYDGCRKVSYGPGGKDCTGKLRNNGRGALLGRFVDDGGTEKIRIEIQPFGPLVASPPSCQDDNEPPASYGAGSTMNLPDLSQRFTQALLSTRESLARPHSKKIRDDVDWHTDCSQPDNGPGDTDNCQTTWSGVVYVTVRPRH